MRDVEYKSTDGSSYECFDCGTVVAAQAPESCPDCGADMRNRKTPIE